MRFFFFFFLTPIHTFNTETKEAYIIDPVLDYDPFSSTVHPSTAKRIIQFTEKYDLKVSKIIDTHVHAVSPTIIIKTIFFFVTK